MSPEERNAPDEYRLYRKVTVRLMPFLFLCYILSYVDRVNVGFAKLQMQHDLKMSEKMFGAGMGVFFIGYFLFEVPCNLLMQRVGARRWLGPLMFVWGLLSSSFMFVKTPLAFYLLRFFLGMVESGFFPGVVLYLTFWFPGNYRARMVAAFMSAIALSGALGGPVSGWIMTTAAKGAGLTGWQWLFLLEGIPSAVVGVWAMFYLDDSPQHARWLQAHERELLSRRLAEDETAKRQRGNLRHTLTDTFKSPQVWLLSLTYFGIMTGNYYVSFWMPQLIKDKFSQDPWHIGLISMIPWGFGAIAMVYWGRHSDLTGERRGHLLGALALAIFGLLLGALHGLPPVAGIALLALATAGIMSAMSTFWALPTSQLSGSAAAAGIAWINSIGNLGGLLSPYAVGALRDRTSEPIYPALLMATACATAAALVLVVTRRQASVRGMTLP